MKRIRAHYGTIKNSKGIEAYRLVERTYAEYIRHKRKAERALLAEVKARYQKEQAVADVEVQLSGRQEQVRREKGKMNNRISEGRQ